jgi:hypothetical protein
MIEVFRIPISKERLLGLPRSERVLLIQLGYVSNQVLMFEKLLMFALKLEPDKEVEQYASGVQAQMLLRLGVGVIYEALRVVERLFLSTEVGREYADKLDDGGVQALNILKKYLGKKSLLFAIRNNYGFHYPESDDTEAAFQAAIADSGFDGMWQAYFSHHGFNSLFLFPDAIFAHGIAAQAGMNDFPAIQKRLVEEFREVSINLVQFSQSFFAAVWLQHFGTWIDAKDMVKIENAPKFDDVVIPFFVEISAGDAEGRK